MLKNAAAPAEFHFVHCRCFLHDLFCDGPYIPNIAQSSSSLTAVGKGLVSLSRASLLHCLCIASVVGVKMDNDVRLGTWPELLYRFIEHYKWEPQHLKVADFEARMRRPEVPLNFMLNMLLRCSAPETIAFLFRAFEPSHSIPDNDLELMFPWKTKATQPDVHLEGTHSRIFIEVKVDAGIKLDQVRKYASLHRKMDERFGAKSHYLLFLTKRSFENVWRPRPPAGSFKDVYSFVGAQLSAQIGGDENAASSVKMLGSHLGDLRQRIQALLVSLNPERLVERRVVSDFLDDLQARGLMLKPGVPLLLPILF